MEEFRARKPAQRKDNIAEHKVIQKPCAKVQFPPSPTMPAYTPTVTILIIAAVSLACSAGEELHIQSAIERY